MSGASVEQAVVRYYREYQKMYLIGGIGTVALGLLFALLVPLTDAKPGAAVFVFGMFALLGIGLCVPGFLDARRFASVQKMRERSPSAIVWLYTFALGRRDYGIKVVVGYDDGIRVDATARRDRADDLLADLRNLAPHATVGWSEEDEARFAANPRSLAR